MKSNPLAKKLADLEASQDPDSGKVDFMRLSHNVHKNMNNGDSYSYNKGEEPDDVKLKNKDMELNFGETPDDEDEKTEEVSKLANSQKDEALETDEFLEDENMGDLTEGSKGSIKNVLGKKREPGKSD